jgi:hypothetical protein
VIHHPRNAAKRLSESEVLRLITRRFLCALMQSDKLADG